MDDLFGTNWNAKSNHETDPFVIQSESADLFSDMFDQSDTQQQTSKHTLDDIFGSDNKKKQVIEYPAFFKSKKHTPTVDVNTLPKPDETKQKDSNISNNFLWDYLDNPNLNNNITKLLFKNVVKPKPKSSNYGTSNFRKLGMLTKTIKKNKISKISPAAKYLISSYFKYECLTAHDVIIPECVEILAIMYLGHPAFIHVYLGDEHAQPLQSSHKLFVVYGYHTLSNIVEEYMESSIVVDAVQTDAVQTDSVLSEFFSEKEQRIWRRDIQMTYPPYNGCYREIFDHIDELFFEHDTMNNNVNMVQYNDWDEFLEIDESKREKTSSDDWEVVYSSSVLFDTKNGLSEIEILIEQKDVLNDWIRHPDTLFNNTQYNNMIKWLDKDKILNLKYYK